MIIGFGNNVVSAIASDITATQTTFSVLPGDGPEFAKLLTTDIANPDITHGIYAKITLTDAQQTVFEICHLTAVTQDTLTVIRGQEGTASKGWSLNDVVANFATRGSEQGLVQIEQLQAGDFTAAKAGGSANALTISLPSTFFINNASQWQLNTPIIVTPIATNTAAATVQLDFAGKVVGTFPLYKGNKAQLEPGDIITTVPFICVLDSTKTFFSVINPTKIYSKLGQAAYLDVGKTKGTVAAGDDARIVNALQRNQNLADVADKGAARNNLGLKGAALLEVGKGAGTVAAGNDTRIVNAIQRNQNLADVADKGAARNNLGLKGAALADVGKGAGTVAAGDDSRIVNAFPTGLANLNVDLNTLGSFDSRGVYYQNANIHATPANHYPTQEAGTLLVTPSAYGCHQEYTAFNSHRKFVRGLLEQWSGQGKWGEWTEYVQLKARQTPEFQHVELYHATPVVDFHFGNSSKDYNVRLINDGSGQLRFLSGPDVGTPIFNNDSGVYIGRSVGTYWAADYFENVAPFRGEHTNVGEVPGGAWVPLVSGKAQKKSGYLTSASFGQFVDPANIFNDPVIKAINDDGSYGIWRFRNLSGDINYNNAAGWRTVAFQDWVQSSIHDPLNKLKLNQDGASYAGFASRDINAPYMRHAPSDAVVFLARKDWVEAGFLAKNSAIIAIGFGAMMFTDNVRRAFVTTYKPTSTNNDVVGDSLNGYVLTAYGLNSRRNSNSGPTGGGSGTTFAVIIARPLQYHTPALGWVTANYS